MKKLFSLSLLGLSLLALSCTDSAATGDFKGVVSEISDSIVVLDVAGSTKTFSAADAKLTNGAVQPGDSAAVKSVSGKAVYIHLIPQTSQEVSLDDLKDNELLTRPATDEEVQAMQDYVEKAKEHQAK